MLKDPNRPRDPNGLCPKYNSCPIDSADETCTLSRWTSYCRKETQSRKTLAQEVVDLGTTRNYQYPITQLPLPIITN